MKIQQIMNAMDINCEKIEVKNLSEHLREELEIILKIITKEVDFLQEMGLDLKIVLNWGVIQQLYKLYMEWQKWNKNR